MLESNLLTVIFNLTIDSAMSFT